MQNKKHNNMEREIKFRAKSKSTNKFIYGVPITTHIGTYMVYEENPHVCSMYGYMEIDGFDLIDDITLGQFTGLKDKNGTEIYEGDIFKLAPSENGKVINKYEVRINSEIFGVECRNTNYSEWNDSFSQLRKDWWDDFKDEVEVVGNIYDNPELIEE